MFLTALAVAAGSWALWSLYQLRSSREWDANAIRTAYVGAQLRETDSAHASLLLSYQLTNTTNADSRLADGPTFVVMSRIKSDRTLSSQEDVRLSYATFLPARQSARVALEVRSPFAWPAENDPQMDSKLKDFVNQRLEGISGFVLFDGADHFQIEFPSGWQELRVVSAANNSSN